MENENKWEYDYSSEHSQTGETGYPNVGSSGMNTANTAGTYGEAAQAAPQAEPNRTMSPRVRTSLRTFLRRSSKSPR